LFVFFLLAIVLLIFLITPLVFSDSLTILDTHKSVSQSNKIFGDIKMSQCRMLRVHF
jgi:hypothetical protein